MLAALSADIGSVIVASSLSACRGGAMDSIAKPLTKAMLGYAMPLLMAIPPHVIGPVLRLLLGLGLLYGEQDQQC